MSSVDTSQWFIVSVAALAGACVSTSTPPDDDDDGTETGSETAATSTGETAGEPECTEDEPNDCWIGYYCDNGECVAYECTEHADCDEGEFCSEYDCLPYDPGQSLVSGAVLVPEAGHGAALSLQFTEGGS